MKKIVRLTESDLNRLVKRVVEENEMTEEGTNRYMFFSNLQQMKRQCEYLLDFDENQVEEILNDGHDWAQDHISESKNSMDQVFDFLMNKINEGEEETMNIQPTVMESRKKTGTKLCVRGKAAAKAKYDVYPSAYANGYAVQVCKGRMPGLDGKKHCSGAYC